MSTVLGRLPGRRDILYAYGGVIFLIYTWALRGFFFQLSSLLLYHPLGDILAILAYHMALALLESLVFMAFLLLLALVLPHAWFAQGFAYKAFLAALISASAAIALETYLTRTEQLSLWLLAGAALAWLLLLTLILLFDSFPRLRTLLLGLIDRISIFSYLYVPLGVLSLLVVLVRMLW